MISGRRAAREAALLVLFAVDSAQIAEPDAALALFRAHFRDDPEVLDGLFGDEVPPNVGRSAGSGLPGAAPALDAKLLAKARRLLADDGPRWAFVERLVRGAMGHQQAIDDLVARCSLHWKVPRMGVVDRNILRLAAYELAFEPDVPGRVTLNEAIELAKRYGTEDSGAFVNGILDRIAQELESV